MLSNSKLILSLCVCDLEFGFLTLCVTDVKYIFLKYPKAKPPSTSNWKVIRMAKPKGGVRAKVIFSARKGLVITTMFHKILED